MFADLSDRDAGKLPLLPGLHFHGQLDRDAAGAAHHHLRDEPPPLPHHQKVSRKIRVIIALELQTKGNKGSRRFHIHGEGPWPVLYDNCVSGPISFPLTVGSMSL